MEVCLLTKISNFITFQVKLLFYLDQISLYFHFKILTFNSRTIFCFHRSPNVNVWKSMVDLFNVLSEVRKNSINIYEKIDEGQSSVHIIIIV